MLMKVISGGQSGADQGAWRAARRFSIPTGGWMPKGFMTEDGPRPEFAALYDAVEHESPEYPPRTRANVMEADLTLVFDARYKGSGRLDDLSPGSRLAVLTAMWEGKRSIVFAVELGKPIDPKCSTAAADRLRSHGVQVLNVAGNRESKAPGIGAWVEAYLCAVFRLLGHEEAR
jgi:hypothetical protein